MQGRLYLAHQPPRAPWLARPAVGHRLGLWVHRLLSRQERAERVVRDKGFGLVFPKGSGLHYKGTTIASMGPQSFFKAKSAWPTTWKDCMLGGFAHLNKHIEGIPRGSLVCCPRATSMRSLAAEGYIGAFANGASESLCNAKLVFVVIDRELHVHVGLTRDVDARAERVEVVAWGYGQHFLTLLRRKNAAVAKARADASLRGQVAPVGGFATCKNCRKPMARRLLLNHHKLSCSPAPAPPQC